MSTALTFRTAIVIGYKVWAWIYNAESQSLDWRVVAWPYANPQSTPAKSSVIVQSCNFSQPADLSLRWIVQCSWHSDTKACPPTPGRLFPVPWKIGGAWMCKLGVISQERILSYYWVLFKQCVLNKNFYVLLLLTYCVMVCISIVC